METRFLTPLKDASGKEAKYSPAAIHLAGLLKTLKSHYTAGSYEEFEKHLSKEIDGKSFTKAECKRLWDALHTVSFYNKEEDRNICGFSVTHELSFGAHSYANFSNFFEEYAKRLLEEGQIIQKRGRVKGKVYPDTESHLADMRAAKAAKKGGIVHEDIFHVEPPKEEEKSASNLFDGLSLSELEQAQSELSIAIKNRREEILGLYTSLKGQIEDLERQVSDLEAKNPWLK